MDKTPKLLIVDDEPQIRRFLRAGLSTQNYDLVEATTGREAMEMIAAETPDLVILDLGLPDIDGTEIIRRTREWSHVPIIVLSVRAGEADKVLALDHGADDYITKPFNISELLARIRAALRHVATVAADEPQFSAGRLNVDFVKRIVLLDNQEVHLSRKEYDILRLLIANAGKVLTHQHLLKTIWGHNFTEQTHYLRVYVGQLRQKLEHDPAQPEYILTEPGVGYRFRLPADATLETN